MSDPPVQPGDEIQIDDDKTYTIGDLVYGSVDSNSWIFNATCTQPGDFLFKVPRDRVSPDFVTSEINANQLAAGCPNAVVGFDFVEKDGNFAFFMERKPHGNLFNFRNSHPEELLPLEIVAHIGFQILQALNHLHQLPMAHRDIKLDNIVLDGDPNFPDAFICDFGLAGCRNVEKGEMFFEPVGTFEYPDLPTNRNFLFQ
jgi:serine/threonine protein kinase